MARRTLRASAAGMERARKALSRFGLTQKELSIEEPPLASWATINGFFNGRAIDHLIFKDICERLHLDWQEICDRPRKKQGAIVANRRRRGTIADSLPLSLVS